MSYLVMLDKGGYAAIFNLSFIAVLELCSYKNFFIFHYVHIKTGI